MDTSSEHSFRWYKSYQNLCTTRSLGGDRIFLLLTIFDYPWLGDQKCYKKSVAFFIHKSTKIKMVLGCWEGSQELRLKRGIIFLSTTPLSAFEFQRITRHTFDSLIRISESRNILLACWFEIWNSCLFDSMPIFVIIARVARSSQSRYIRFWIRNIRKIVHSFPPF